MIKEIQFKNSIKYFYLNVWITLLFFFFFFKEYYNYNFRV